jgi:hypothetical protein
MKQNITVLELQDTNFTNGEKIQMWREKNQKWQKENE